MEPNGIDENGKGRTALVTGSASGLGRETALRFAAEGYRVFAGVRRLEDGEALRRLSANITPVVLDVTDDAQIAAAAELIDRACGDAGLAVLVNMAGQIIYGPVEYARKAEVAALFDTVTFAPYRLANAMLPALKRSALRRGERAKVLNVVSWASLDANPFVGFYAAAKAALLRLTQAQSLELDRFGVDAIAVVPGLMKTRFIERAAAQIRDALASLPAQGVADYGAHLEHMATMSAAAPRNPLASEPGVIARKLVAISRKRRPRDRYDLGVDTQLVKLLDRFLPYWLLRAMKRALFGLDRPTAALAP